MRPMTNKEAAQHLLEVMQTKAWLEPKQDSGFCERLDWGIEEHSGIEGLEWKQENEIRRFFLSRTSKLIGYDILPGNLRMGYWVFTGEYVRDGKRPKELTQPQWDALMDIGDGLYAKDAERGECWSPTSETGARRLHLLEKITADLKALAA